MTYIVQTAETMPAGTFIIRFELVDVRNPSDPSSIGIDSDFQHLRAAKKKLDTLDFVNASIELTPFNNNSIDRIAIIEVLEHIPSRIYGYGLRGSIRQFKNNGILIVSIPYNENIIKGKCIHCGKVTPLYGHFRRMDEKYIRANFGNNANLILRTMYMLPNIQMISCKPFLKLLFFCLWLLLNDLLGQIKSYWAVYCLSKE